MTITVGREVHVAGLERVRVVLLDATDLALAVEHVPVPEPVAELAARLRTSLAALQRELETADLIGRAVHQPRRGGCSGGLDAADVPPPANLPSAAYEGMHRR